MEREIIPDDRQSDEELKNAFEMKREITPDDRERIKKNVWNLFEKIRAEVDRKGLMEGWLKEETISLESFEQWQVIRNELPEYENFGERMQPFMKSHPKFNPVMKNKENLSFILDIYLMSWFLYFSENPYSFESKGFSECLEIFEKIYVSTLYIVKPYLCFFLEGIKSETSPIPEDDGMEIKFDEKLKIKKSRKVVEEFERKYLLKTDYILETRSRHMGLVHYNTIKTDYILETKYYEFYRIFSGKDEIYGKLLSTLRLKYRGRYDGIGCRYCTLKLILSTRDGLDKDGGLFKKVKINLENICYPFGSYHLIPNSFYYLGNYELKKEDEGDLKKLYEKLKNLPEFLEIPLKRFNFGYERSHNEDRLIDYIVALDSLFFKKDERSSSYVLSLRTASLLKEDGTMKKSYFELVKRAYDFRNKIVHKGKFDIEEKIQVNNEEISFPELVSKIEDVLRESIEKALEYKDKEPFIEYINDKIFSDDKKETGDKNS